MSRVRTDAPLVDLAVIGGGIVGMATAMRLLEREPALSVAVFEKEKRVAAHQTGHNSGVIHAGLYYRTGSLKARNCTAGREALYRFCSEHHIPHERCGKVVVATREEELPVLDELERRGLANGLAGLERLDAKGIRAWEPHARGIGGLFVPQTGIVDYVQVTEAFAGEVRRRGGEIRLKSEVLAVSRNGDGFRLVTGRGALDCRRLINCTGLHSDRFARLCGIEPGLRIIPFRGEYYHLHPGRRGLVRNLIYPVPDPALPFLGVHFTRMVDGTVEAGPNAVLAWKREGYRWYDISFRDSFETLAFPGFWRLGKRFWRVGLQEYYRSLSKSAFVRSLQRLVPELQPVDVSRGGAGVRAQAVDGEGKLLDDFRIIEAQGMIHVLNAPSPAATASLSIGQTIAEQALGSFGLD